MVHLVIYWLSCNMKNVKEEDIRPEKIFDEYLRLARIDAHNFFYNSKKLNIKCPACGKDEYQLWAKKDHFEYQICNNCKSIYVSPRPLVKHFNSYYQDSPSTEFWATTFYKETESARREKLWVVKAKLVKDLLTKYQGVEIIKNLVDIGGGYGVFDEEISKIMKLDITVIEPSVHLANICRGKGFNVIEKFMEDIEQNELTQARKCFVSFELFEHLHDPQKFLINLNKCMNTGDIFIFTTLSGIGLDIQALKEDSKALSPPHHLNFLNPKSVSMLLERNGYNVLEAITPGKLDINILEGSKDKIKDTFWKNYIDYSSDSEKEKMQQYISESGLSSHMMITSVKK